MFDFDGLAPKIRALRATFLNWTVTTADLLLTRVDTTVSSAVTAANAATAAAEKPPKVSGLVGVPTANSAIQVMDELLTTPAIAEVTAACSTFDVWVNLVNYTGSGVLTFAALYQIDNSASRDARVEILIDGVSVYASDADLFKTASTDDDKGVVPVGLLTSGSGPSGLAESRVKFSSSLVIRAKKTENAAGAVNVGGRVRYQAWT